MELRRQQQEQERLDEQMRVQREQEEQREEDEEAGVDPARRAAARAWVLENVEYADTNEPEKNRSYEDLIMLVPGELESLASPSSRTTIEDGWVYRLTNNATVEERVRFVKTLTDVLADDRMDAMWDFEQGVDLAYDVLLNGTQVEVDAGLDLLGAFAYYQTAGVDHRMGYDYDKIPILKRFLQEGTPTQKEQVATVIWSLMTNLNKDGSEDLLEAQLRYGRKLVESGIHDELALCAQESQGRTRASCALSP